MLAGGNLEGKGLSFGSDSTDGFIFVEDIIICTLEYGFHKDCCYWFTTSRCGKMNWLLDIPCLFLASASGADVPCPCPIRALVDLSSQSARV